MTPPLESMLLVLPVPFREQDGQLLFEKQACNGIQRWAENFPHITVAAPVYPEFLAQKDSTMAWRPLSELSEQDCFTFVTLPWAYHPGDFVRSYKRVRALLAEHIRKNAYLQFAIGGTIGDWPAIGALEAIRQKRRFAIHTDRVEHQVVLEVARNVGLPRKIYIHFMATVMKHYHRYLIKRCSLGLWHGADCFHAYSPWCKQSYLIHDVHTSASDCIEDTDLAAKLDNVTASETLHVCYAGRMDPMKAPLEWLRAIGMARDLGAKIKAVWYGEGPLRREMEEEAERLRLKDIVGLPGFVRDRSTLLAALRSAHLMLFTHVTQESPRCLLEALLSGTPIIGYESRYSDDLTEKYGGGSYTAVHDWRALGEKLAALAADRKQLSRLIQDAANNGKRFNDVAVFAERSELIKKYCG